MPIDRNSQIIDFVMCRKCKQIFAWYSNSENDDHICGVPDDDSSWNMTKLFKDINADRYGQAEDR
ncbi:hypothetical protein KAR91_23265 [Candidatus Pacearchaeota archaeon]|nr:hypothetical protein [Candidatus Pacearchaeota archaeon]